MSRILKRIAAGVVIAGVAALLLAAGGYAAGCWILFVPRRGGGCAWDTMCQSA